jgi:hypothetical protein
VFRDPLKYVHGYLLSLPAFDPLGQLSDGDCVLQSYALRRDKFPEILDRIEKGRTAELGRDYKKGCAEKKA